MTYKEFRGAEILHEPVLVNEVVQILQPQKGGTYLDCTVGAGGHARAILEACEGEAQLVGIDCDQDAVIAARTELIRFGNRAKIYQGNFVDADRILGFAGIESVDGILLDLGVSSIQLEMPERGFSFMKEGPLDMRMDRSKTLTAREIVNRWRAEDIERILRDYGEERFSSRIAKRIVEERQRGEIRTTIALADIIRRAVSKKGGGHKRIHPATRTFQALRIAVNSELQNLTEFLSKSLGILKKGGRIAIISFHSLEDRIVKRNFKEWERSGLVKLLNRRVIRPTIEEVRRNPRARSAKLRGAMKIA